MNNSMHTIVEKLALLEGRINQDSKPKSKSVPALLKKESLMPVIGNPGSVSESGVAEDVLSKVKDSFTDYLKNLEDQIKQDKDLLKKKKEDLDLKKSELKDLDLQIKDRKAQADRAEELEEEPNQTPATGEAPAGSSNPTYAQGSNNTYESSAPVKTVVLDEMGGSVLVEIHGSDIGGYEIRRNGRSLPTRFKTVSDCEMALDLYRARRAEQNNPDSSADYLEEK